MHQEVVVDSLVEKGTSFEAGWYIGTIKTMIVELQVLQGKK